jgi:SAM-dependent methyltransferase
VKGFKAGDDLCLGFWKQVYDAGRIQIPKGAKVLEIGCAEADWLTPMHEHRPDLHLVGIDWRACARPGASQVIQGDVLTHEFPPESFDLVVLVSAVEHIGLGGYDADPQSVDGDCLTMLRVRQWLKPGGLCYFDVPYRINGTYEVRSKFRIYHPESLKTRLVPEGLTVNFVQTMPSSHPDGPYLAVVLQKA